MLSYLMWTLHIYHPCKQKSSWRSYLYYKKKQGIDCLSSDCAGPTKIVKMISSRRNISLIKNHLLSLQVNWGQPKIKEYKLEFNLMLNAYVYCLAPFLTYHFMKLGWPLNHADLNSELPNHEINPLFAVLPQPRSLLTCPRWMMVLLIHTRHHTLGWEH